MICWCRQPGAHLEIVRFAEALETIAAKADLHIVYSRSAAARPSRAA
jgi:hypothetical protein